MDLLFDTNNDGSGGFWNWGIFAFFSGGGGEINSDDYGGFWNWGGDDSDDSS